MRTTWLGLSIVLVAGVTGLGACSEDDDPTPPAEVLTLREGAGFLRISERKAWEMVDQDLIPHFRVGNQIRFHLDDLRKWIRSQSGDVSR